MTRMLYVWHEVAHFTSERVMSHVQHVNELGICVCDVTRDYIRLVVSREVRLVIRR